MDMEFEIIFYRDISGRAPVQDFLDEIRRKNNVLWVRTIAGLEKLRYKDFHKEPLSKFLGDGLWELRVKSGNNILRIIYIFLKGKKIILLHGFIKKTQKTPVRELDIAKKRAKSIRK